MVNTALDPGSRRVRASVTAAGSELFSCHVPVLANQTGMRPAGAICTSPAGCAD
jgi:hypothetical protein